MVTPEDKQSAKEIMVAYITHGGAEWLFDETPLSGRNVEAAWSRIITAVSGDAAKQSPTENG